MAGRPERVLPDDGTALTSLALGLRELKRAGGNPGYREMARRVHRSPTTLSEAAGGSQVPTWETVEAYVRACGGDPGPWRSRWEAAAAVAVPVTAGTAAEMATGMATGMAVEKAGPPVTASTRAGHRRRWALAGAALAVVLLSAGFVATRNGSLDPASAGTGPAGTEAPPPTVTLQVRDGSDPQDTGCARLPGVVMLDTTEVDVDGLPAGEAQLKYSPGCGAAWPRFQPFPKASIPTHAKVHVDIVRPDDGDARYPFDAPYVGAPVFGNLAVSTSKCVYAAVRIEQQGKVTESRTHCFRGATYVR